MSLVGDMRRTERVLQRGVIEQRRLVCADCGCECELRNTLLVCTSEACGRVHEKLAELAVGAFIR